MNRADRQLESYPGQPPLRERVAGIAVAVGINLLLLLMLLTLAAPAKHFVPMVKRGTITFDLAPAEEATPEASPQKATVKAAAETRAAAQPTPRPAPKESAAAEAQGGGLGILEMSGADFAATDVSRLPSVPRGGGGADGGGAPPSGGGAGTGGHSGPHGEPLYGADWYREPTNAELAFYLPKVRARTGWGLIACRTVADNRVEDCVELEESPRGSGFARAVREAAWQFRVLPPRVGTRRLVGEWVSIQITYGEKRAAAE
ncbi:hypothetical protein [Sphingomonas sp. ID0503]|uniref:hypothetical protein n=1 Tax=Sphingomonas sp. ID0503 TaxID=3399691 RepID=UPI003AFAD6B0